MEVASLTITEEAGGELECPPRSQAPGAAR